MTNLTLAILTDHARDQLAQRGLAESMIRQVLAAPGQVLDVRPGRVVAQSRLDACLVRVFVDIDRTPPEVVTAYKTSKIVKYWSKA